MTGSKREFLKMLCAGGSAASLSGVASAGDSAYRPDVEVKQLSKQRAESLYEAVSADETVRSTQEYARTIGGEFDLTSITGYTLTEGGRSLHNLKVGLQDREGSVDIRVGENNTATLLTVDNEVGVDAYVSTDGTVSANSLSSVQEYTEWQSSAVTAQGDFDCKNVNIGFVCDFFQVLAAGATIVITIIQPETAPITIKASQLIAAGCTLGDFLPGNSSCDISTVDFCTKFNCFDEVGVIYCGFIPDVKLKICE
ncbi:hypothetical protein [Halobaculum sp. MBLA0143]|uniref:hypothetical protein n=1 Tax=Halobaculum sp. MBLA0143 TaxID=3079933 RepID=UPI0035247163